MSRGQRGAWPLASFGITRACLLITFIVLSALTYLYVDAHTIHRFLVQVQQDPYGSLHTFTVVYAVSVVVLFPCMILQVMSGALYGFWMGMVVSCVATNIGQILAFILGRYLFRPTVKAYLHSTWPMFPAIDAAIKKEGWKLVCLLRLSPVLPYNILNYALAITPVSMVVFAAASAIATLPWTALYVYLGTFSNNLMDLTQGKISYGDRGDMAIIKKVASGVFIVVTTVYGYILSHRAVSAVLKDAADHLPPMQSPPPSSNPSSTDLVSMGDKGLDRAQHAQHAQHGILNGHNGHLNGSSNGSANGASHSMLVMAERMGSSGTAHSRHTIEMLGLDLTDRGTQNDLEHGRG